MGKGLILEIDRPGKYKVRLKYLVPENRKCLKNDGDVSKRHRIQLECVCAAQFWKKI